LAAPVAVVLPAAVDPADPVLKAALPLRVETSPVVSPWTAKTTVETALWL